MTLHVAGIMHYDPLGRDRLKKWFEDLKHKNVKVSYLLLEYHENDPSIVCDLRKDFRKLCEDGLKEYRLTQADLDILENSFWYELDSHFDYFPNVKSLYLDKEKEESKYKNLPKELIDDNYPIVLEKCDKNSNNFIQTLSKETWIYLNKQWEFLNKNYGLERDKYLFEQIVDKTSSFNNDNGLLIIGRNHIRDYPNKCIDLLKKNKLYKNIYISNLENIF